MLYFIPGIFKEKQRPKNACYDHLNKVAAAAGIDVKKEWGHGFKDTIIDLSPTDGTDFTDPNKKNNICGISEICGS